MIKGQEKMKDDGNNVFQSREPEPFRDSLSLKQRLWAFKYKGNIILSIILFALGTIALILSYVFSFAIITFIGLGLVLFGVIAFNILPSRYMPEEFTYTLLLSSLKSISGLLGDSLDYGKAIFFYSKSQNGLSQGFIFISTEGSLSIPTEEQIVKSNSCFCSDPKGLYIKAPSQGFVDILEEEAGKDFATIDLAHMQQIVQKLLVEDLKVVEEVLIEDNDAEGNVILAKIVGASCARLCEAVAEKTRLGNQFGCPICASLALIISKVTKRPVIIKETNVMRNTIKTTFLILDL
jgi:hypothetical protein